MRKGPSPPEKLLDYCRHWSEAVANIKAGDERMAYFKMNLPALLRNQMLVEQILLGISRGLVYGEHPGGLLFPNEVLLYLDPARRFSLRMYIHAPEDYTAVHDHSAWGVLGSAVGGLHIIKYDRRDDGARPDRAALRKSGERFLNPGETDVTLPLDDGIHKTGNAAAATGVVLNVYGTPLRRLHINRFDLESGVVSQIYPPRLHRKRLAAGALETLRHGTADLR